MKRPFSSEGVGSGAKARVQETPHRGDGGGGRGDRGMASELRFNLIETGVQLSRPAGRVCGKTRPPEGLRGAVGQPRNDRELARSRLEDGELAGKPLELARQLHRGA